MSFLIFPVAKPAKFPTVPGVFSNSSWIVISPLLVKIIANKLVVLVVAVWVAVIVVDMDQVFCKRVIDWRQV